MANASLEAGINKQLNPIRSQIYDLSQTQAGDKTRKHNLECALDQKIDYLQARHEQSFNKKIKEISAIHRICLAFRMKDRPSIC